MPKRDEAYMQAQRDAIARAALAVFLEKGAYSVSLRDICAAAGVSIGALYVHFASREEVIAAACVIRWQDDPMPPAETWADYEHYLTNELIEMRLSKNAAVNRLALQMVAELPHMENSPPGLAETMRAYREWFVKALSAAERRGEISLPLGLEQTVEIHIQLASGSYYQGIIDRETPSSAIADATRLALATTAGLREPK